MSIKIESVVEDHLLIELLSKNKYLIKDNYINSVNKYDFINNEFYNYLNDDKNIVRYIFLNEKLIGVYILKRLDWDSQIFNKSMWKMKLVLNQEMDGYSNNLETIFLKDCRQYGIDHISCQVDSRNNNNIRFLEKINFKLTDSIIRFGTRLNNFNIEKLIESLDSKIIIREYENKDYVKYLNLVKQTFYNYSNRFKNDGSFTEEQCEKFYTEWAKNSIEGFADLVIVAENSNELYGFSTLKYKKPYNNKLVIAEGQLAGVSNFERGQGINTSMMLERLLVASYNADYYEVGTQVYNYASQRSFYRCGLKPFESYFTFHKSIN